MSKLNHLDIARKYFPKCSNNDLHNIAMTHTGFPSWWATKPGESVEDCFRRQLRQFKDGNCNCPDCSAVTTVKCADCLMPLSVEDVARGYSICAPCDEPDLNK